ncbi:MAG: helix-turn-helix transcriptional regulator [Altererythrobacter sp.]|nr:helix-turn-helix transcriptional regulator [Altererythrobacter sp.]
MDCHAPAIASDTPSCRAADVVPAFAFADGPRHPVPAALAAMDTVPAHLRQAAAARGMNRYRLHVGELIVELRHFPRQAGADYHLSGRRALLLVPLTHDLELVTATAHLTCPAGAAFLLARDEAVTGVWHAGAWALAVHLRPERVNAAASAASGDARRLASVAAVLPAGDKTRGSAPMAQRLIALIAGATLQQGPAMLALEASIYRQLAGLLLDRNEGDAWLSPVRAVGEAMRLVRENHARAYDTEALAALVGVTASTLRKGFRASLGMSVKEYIQMVRLDWAHDRLTGGHESRPIAVIAQAAGFAETPPFSRAYMKRFGEPPSQTRARAVRAVPV